MADEASSSATSVLAQMRALLGLDDLSGLSLDALERRTRRQLLDWAHRLGVPDLQRLTKDALARRLRDVLASFGPAPLPADEPTGATASHKFDLGLRDEHPVEHIPWGYGGDRITAMAVDPDRLFVYWEVTDDAIARARQGLGPGGPEAWLDLRVYDVSGRIFDGTNAHGYVDQRIERDTRQWFFLVRRPTSTAVVEIGLLSYEGYYVRIARSGRADFPRREPAPPTGVEWLTVRTARGPVESARPGDPVTTNGHRVTGPTVAPPAPAAASPGEEAEPAGKWEACSGAEWTEGGQWLAWRSPVLHTSWESGPFTYPIASPVYVEERHHGTVTVRTHDGRTHVVYGPWQVVIRGLGAHRERHVVSTWELSCTWDGAPLPSTGGHLPAGAGGASERLGASERRLRGASELYYVGASERHWRGASEWWARGASERRLGGASERRLEGASETRLGGGSERRPPR